MKYNQYNLKKYISLKIKLEEVKNSNLYLSDLKTYINKQIKLYNKLNLLKF